jgi:hypothetical protein
MSDAMKISNDPRYRDALLKDKIEIAVLLREVLNSEQDMRSALLLQGDDAQELLDSIQAV